MYVELLGWLMRMGTQRRRGWLTHIGRNPSRGRSKDYGGSMIPWLKDTVKPDNLIMLMKAREQAMGTLSR